MDNISYVSGIPGKAPTTHTRKREIIARLCSKNIPHFAIQI
jgi:hypothetical protein